MTAEPRVEELLATIRKAIDHDISELDKRGVALGGKPQAPQSAPQAKDADQDIAHLRSRVGRQRADASFAPLPSPQFKSLPPKLEPRNTGISSILTAPSQFDEPIPPAAILRPSYAAEETRRKPRPSATPLVSQPRPVRYVPLPEPVPYEQPHEVYQHPPQDATWVEEQPHQAPPEAYYPQQPGALMSPQSAYAAQASFQALANTLVQQMGGDGRLQDISREMLQPLLKEWLDENLPQLVEKLVREEIERVARRGR